MQLTTRRSSPAGDATVSDARGQVLVLFALFLVVLVGSAALTIDYGSWLKFRRDYQNGADAAALAGAAHLSRPITPAKQIAARRAAWETLNAQLGLGLTTSDLDGLDDGNTPAGPPSVYNGYRIWVSSPANGAGSKYPGAYTSAARTVFVWVEHDNPSYFSQLFGQNGRNVPAWANAGTFPNRFAVITLRKNGQPTNGNPTDIDINGGTVLSVHDGDVGGNWGMAINGVGSQLRFTSSTGDAYGAYLTENVPTGGNGWTPDQVVDASNNPLPVQFIQEVPDPAYPAPCVTYGVAGCLVDQAAALGSNYNASTDRVGETCPYDLLTNVDRLPGGRYDNIKIPNGKCVFLDPTYGGVASKNNGVYYITGTLDINNSGLVIGNGVTLVFDRNSNLNMNAGASISLNQSTNGCGGQDCKFAAWTSGGTYSWSTGPSPTYSVPANPFFRGMAAYVCRSAADCGSGGSPSTKIFQMNSNNTGIDYRGLIYAPLDNVKVAGQPNHKDIGQIVAWTVMFTGGVGIDQTYDGPDSATPVLLEPRTGQATYP